MPSNADPIVPQIREAMHRLLRYVTGPDAANPTAATVELTLFRPLLARGAALLRLFFLTRPAARPAAPTADDGTVWTYHDQRMTTYLSVFGKLCFARQCCIAAGRGGCWPIDAELRLSARCYSDRLRACTGYNATDGAYRETASTSARIWGRDLRVQARETNVPEDAPHGAAFYAQPPRACAPRRTGAILVVQADGKARPMIPPPPTDPPLRLGKGHKRTKKKEAIVTGRYPIAPYVRTPADVRAALLHAERSGPSSVTRQSMIS